MEGLVEGDGCFGDLCSPAGCGMMKGCELQLGRDVFLEDEFAKGAVLALGVPVLPRAVLLWPLQCAVAGPAQAEPVGSMLVLDSTAA